jgi:hypothetical protein
VRAYLTYELFGQASFITPVRLINGSLITSSMAGGTIIAPTTTWSTQVERLNPAWFNRGTNSVSFRVLSSSFSNAGYTVRNVRIVGELDSGANAIETITANQPDALGTNPIESLYDGDLATGWQPYPSDQPIDALSPSVEIAFRRPTQMDAVSSICPRRSPERCRSRSSRTGCGPTSHPSRGGVTTPAGTRLRA